MRINVISKLPPGFLKGLASKNAEIYLDCLDIISTMSGGLSFKEKYEDVKEQIRIYLEDTKVTVENEEDLSFSANLDKRPGEIISQMIKFGWLETDTKEGSFEKEVYITKYAHLLYTGFIKPVDTPKKVEFSNYIIAIYNLVRNRDTWENNPYYNFLKPIHEATESLSNALTEMNTYAKDMIAEMMAYDTYHDVTEALIRNTVDDFSEEFSRLSVRNIHWFRTGRPGNPGIIDGLESLLEEPDVISLMASEYGKENNTDELTSRQEVIDMLYGIIEFMQEKYDRLYNDIQMKIEKYVDTMIGRLRFIRQLHNEDGKENIAKLLEIIRLKLGAQEDMSDTDCLFSLYKQEIIDPDQACRKRETHTVHRQIVKNVKKLSTEDRERARKHLQEKAENPFSMEKVCTFVENNSVDGVLNSAEIPIEDKTKLLMLLAGAMYATNIHYRYQDTRSYHTDNNFAVKEFTLTKAPEEDAS